MNWNVKELLRNALSMKPLQSIISTPIQLFKGYGTPKGQEPKVTLVVDLAAEGITGHLEGKMLVLKFASIADAQDLCQKGLTLIAHLNARTSSTEGSN